MKLPRAEGALVPQEKLVDYLLSRTHPRGQHKAALFEALGFSRLDWRELADSLRRHARAHDIVLQDDTEFGTWYTLDGALECPSGARAWIRTVWFVDKGDNFPRFVTAYPVKPRSS